MRQNLTLFLFLYSLCGFAQLYVHQGIVLHLETPNSTLSIQEAEIHINSSIDGQGTLVFNSVGLQTLESTQEVLEIPNLILQNADRIRLHTPLRVAQHFTLQTGEHHLEQPLYLLNPQALRLLGNSSLQNIEFLVLDLQQIDHTQPHWVWNPSLSECTIQTKRLRFAVKSFKTNRPSISVLRLNHYKTLYLHHNTPPPEVKSLA